MPLSVLIADDQSEVRSALRLLLEEEMGAVIYEADDAPALAEILKVRQPRLMLLDWELPGLNRAALPVLRDIYPVMRVIALDNRPRSESAASSSGVDGFVCRCCPPQELLAAIRRAVA